MLFTRVHVPPCSASGNLSIAESFPKFSPTLCNVLSCADSGLVSGRKQGLLLPKLRVRKPDHA